MKLEDQVCTLEQSEKLQELGIKSDSQFYYAVNGIKKPLLIWGNIDYQGGRYTHWEKHPAYTVAELGEMLPESAESTNGNINQFFTGKFMGGGFNCVWYYTHNEIAPTEAQARAAMLIFLLENAILSTSKTPEQ